ncbi:unnamed protein product [Clonostachys rosea f. rosea IK726]|uniref:ATP-dependent DNA helicase n=2 Tax=Bionectria ochroleuca TaxID=29856 RepID=A0A0B7JJF6_BIOOC|nr:unnamed protein product [Clonostachys rosea f. rosea IK726]
MESDEFDDGLADEDLMEVLDKTSSSANHQSSAGPTSSAAIAAAVAELDDLPSDAFSSPEPFRNNSSITHNSRASHPPPRIGLNRSNSSVLRQTTLFGGQASTGNEPWLSQTQTTNARVYRVDLPREEPTHHELEKDALQTWVYPTNLGAIRDYQFSIVKNSLFNNTLVALPTGLGKTFIAATVMLNFHRWTKSAKIVFVAPTKPLVAQQIDACYNIAGIPRSETTLLTGDINPAVRAEEWEQRRVFFMTPQTLMNDLSHGYADPKKIVLLVVDEAHRAVGEYAYAKVTKFIRQFSNSLRVLALTATPGSKVETVQEIIDNLGISHCEIRTEESIDIQQYVHQRNIDQQVLDPSEEMVHVSDLFTKALQPLVDKLSAQNVYYGRNPMALTAFGLLQTQKEWFATRGRGANQGLQGMMRAVFSVLTSIAHSIKLLNFHGIKPFYDNLSDMRKEQEAQGQKGSKYRRQLINDPSFQEMMDIISKWLRTDGFVGHPKLTALATCVLNHLVDTGESTRIIVFSEYRDSAEDIVRMLNKHRPLVKASIFVGQADGKRAEGMKQAQQIETIEKFRRGDFNVLVATSIGEEGLDIGQVDLIVCYDSSASPIRMLQRMGRTGRKRAGNIVLLLMRGKEEEQFAKSKDNYEKMQKLICEGSRFNFRFDLSKRILPRDARPEVDKRRIDIPIENTQDTSLPEPKRRRVPGKKKPPKKFHMPEGVVETGFKTLSAWMGKSSAKTTSSKVSAPRKDSELSDLAAIPDLSSVVLSSREIKDLDRLYRDLPFNNSAVEETNMPSLVAFPKLQKRLRPVGRVKHGDRTESCVKLLQKMARPDEMVRECRSEDPSNYMEIPVKAFVASDYESDADGSDAISKLPKPKPRKRQVERKTPVGGQRKRRKVQDTPLLEPDLEVEEAGGDALDEEDEENIGLTARIRKKPKAKKKKRAKATGKGASDLEIGDDCERDSDLLETDGSDMGEDLQDFIVSDNIIPSTQPDGSMSSSPASNHRPSLASTHRSAAFNLSATQESDDLPDLDALTGRNKEPGESVSGLQRTGRGRRQILDSDSDE